MSGTSALRDSTLFCVAWIYFLGPVFSSSDPLYLFPFSNSTFAYDVMEGRNGEYRDTWVCPEFEAGPSNFDGEALVFKGRETYVEFEMKKKKLDHITFVIFVYAYDTTGVILDYTVNEIDKDTVHGVTIELERENVKLTVNTTSGILSVVSQEHILPRTWSFIAFSKVDQTYSLQVHGSRRDQTGSNPRIKFDADGELNIARDESSRGALLPFKGRLSCLSVWDQGLPEWNVITTWCHEQRWPKKPLNPTPLCNAAVPPVAARVTHLWPLSLSSNGYDVVNNVKPNTSAPFQCFFTSRVTYPATNRSVVYLDGSAIAYLDAVMPTINVTSDVTVAIAVMPDQLVEGVIWDIQMPSLPGTDQRWRLRLSFTNEYPVFELLNATVANRSGIIRIGQALDPRLSTTGYHGSVACLAVVGGVVDRNTIKELVEKHCKDMDKENIYVWKENCSAKQGVTGTRFRMTASDMCPAPKWSPLSTNRTVMSLLKCSTQCTTLSECRSFAFNTTSSTDNCRVYDFVTRSGLVADEGCNYYSVARD